MIIGISIIFGLFLAITLWWDDPHQPQE